MNLKLRPYQEKAVDDLRKSFREGNKSPVLQLPTGGGKTVCFSFIAEQMANNKKSVFILAHRSEIIKQISRTLRQFGVNHGLISPQFTPSLLQKIQVGSVQTLVRRLDRYTCPDLIITDECHHSTSPTYRKIYDHYKKAKLLGVTATPCRTDGKGLNAVYDDISIGPTMSWLIENEFLSDYKVFAPPSGLDMTGVRKGRNGDYQTSETVERVDKKTITGCAVEHYQKICPGAPAIAFCASVAHAEHVASAFIQAGIPAKSIDGKMTEEVRHSAIEDLEKGKIKVLTSCDIVSEGTDIPVVTAAILLRPTLSLIFHLQSCGRALRTHPSKKISYIIDHVGNCLTHGLPDDEREWTLDGDSGKKKKKKEDEVSSVKQCPECYCVHRSVMKQCPECGYIYTSKIREPDQIDGELVEMQKRKAEEEYIKEQAKYARKRKQASAETIEQLIAFGQSMGYKNPEGWAKHIYDARQKKKEKNKIIA